MFIMKVRAYTNQMFYHESMRSHMLIVCCIMRICAHVHKMLYHERMRSHMYHMFYYENMCSRASHVSLRKYVFPHASYCFLTNIYAHVHRMFNYGSMCSRASCVFWLTWKVFTLTCRLAFVRGFRARTEARVHHSLFSIVLLWHTNDVVCVLITFFGSWLFVMYHIH